MDRLKGLFVLEASAAQLIYGEPEHRAIAELIDIDHRIYSSEEVATAAALRDCDVIMSGWGGPLLDARFLDAAPKLKALFYGAGSLAGTVTEWTWKRGVQVTTAIAANGRPVAEYTLGMILLGLKGVFRISADIRRDQAFFPFRGQGCYGSTVGIVSLSTIGRAVLNLLKPFDLKVIAYDPFVSSDEASKLGVTLVSLDEIFRQSDVVSIHTPLLKETDGMVTGRHIAEMKQYATLINTARGGIIREIEMVDVLVRRPDLQVILDVTSPEPPIKGSPLYRLPNVMLTPHIAGSKGNECRRLGQFMVSELRRFVNHEPLQWAVTKESTLNSTHRPAWYA